MTGRGVAVLTLVIFLTACSRQESGSTAAAPAKPQDAKEAYLQYCSGCHAAPQPGAYVARDWPAIVARMQQRRMGVGLGAIPPDTYQQILDYLQQNAADSGP